MTTRQEVSQEICFLGSNKREPPLRIWEAHNKIEMSGKDVLRLLLISYGFCRNIEISTYVGEGGWIGYEVSANNDDGLEYYDVNCEGLLFHIHEIQHFMREENVVPRIMGGNYSNKHLLSDEHLKKLLSIPENEDYCKTNPCEKGVKQDRYEENSMQSRCLN